MVTAQSARVTLQPRLRPSLLGDPRLRGAVFQLLALAGVIGLGWFLVANTLDNLEKRSIATGFDFLGQAASFAIGESLIPYSPADTYGRAFLVGLLNTLKVALIGIALATLLGTLTGIARLSRNWLVSRLAGAYIETVRNVPLLLQLFVWYSLITEGLPLPRQAWNPLPGVFLSNRGLTAPLPEAAPGWWAAAIALVLALLLSWGVRVWNRRRQAATGRTLPAGWISAGLIIGLPLLAWAVAGAPTAMDLPVLRGFNFRGGLMLSPEFAALMLGLVIYTATFIAEIVRSGILAISKGQTEAGLALGLSRGQILRRVTLPQALRIIIPPLTSQYLNLTKNSSLAVAIGYPDLVAVLNTTVNQTGQAIEGVAMIMAVYLTISLAISLFMNWYNKQIALVER